MPLFDRSVARTQPRVSSDSRPGRPAPTESVRLNRLDCSDVDLFHLHHRIEMRGGSSGIRIGYRFGQSDRRDLPGQSPFVLAQPPALSSPPLPKSAFQ